MSVEFSFPRDGKWRLYHSIEKLILILYLFLNEEMNSKQINLQLIRLQLEMLVVNV